jgi:hypothetical protein
VNATLSRGRALHTKEVACRLRHSIIRQTNTHKGPDIVTAAGTYVTEAFGQIRSGLRACGHRHIHLAKAEGQLVQQSSSSTQPSLTVPWPDISQPRLYQFVSISVAVGCPIPALLVPVICSIFLGIGLSCLRVLPMCPLTFETPLHNTQLMLS